MVRRFSPAKRDAARHAAGIVAVGDEELDDGVLAVLLAEQRLAPGDRDQRLPAVRQQVDREVDDQVGVRAHDPCRVLGPLDVAGTPVQPVGDP